jgi:hypothetical protein
MVNTIPKRCSDCLTFIPLTMKSCQICMLKRTAEIAGLGSCDVCNTIAIAANLGPAKVARVSSSCFHMHIRADAKTDAKLMPGMTPKMKAGGGRALEPIRRNMTPDMT